VVNHILTLSEKNIEKIRKAYKMTRKNANKSNEYPEQWLNLSDAAQFLGVHFTTLRRWADAGQISCIRTPGGRRRFSKNDLQAFINNMRQADAHSVSLAEYSNAIQYARKKSIIFLPLLVPGWTSWMEMNASICVISVSV
jgi:excisionase family DNA binding protein